MDYDSIRREEFERVAMPHAERLLRLALRIERDRARAEDAVQETLLCAWRAFDQFERGTNCKAWLFRILLNLLNKSRRRRQATPTFVSLDEPGVSNVIRLPSARVRSADLEILEAFEELSEDHRVVLFLAAVEGFTCKEIARLCDAPIGTVMSRLSRARAELRRSLGYAERKRRATACGD